MKTCSTLGSLTVSLEGSFEKPNQYHTTLYKFTQIPHAQTSIKLLKNYLDTFKEPLQDRIQIIKRPIVSKTVQIERRQSYNEKKFKNYERMIAYSIKNDQIDSIRKKYSKSLKSKKAKLNIPNLKEIVQDKMIKELASENNFSNKQSNKIQSQEIIENILKNNQQRQELFQQSIFMDRLLCVKKQSRKTKDSKNTPSFDSNSKHFHLNEIHRNQKTFYRRKFTRKSLTFDLESRVNQFEITKLRKSIKQNQILMRDLMNNYSKQLSTQREANSTLVHQTLKRIFLHYSNRTASVEQSYKFITKAKFSQFFTEFQFTESINLISEEMQRVKQMNFLEFTEILFTLSSKLMPSSQNTFFDFIEKYLLVKSSIFIPKQCQDYTKRKEMIQNYLKVKKTQQKIQIICSSESSIGATDSKGNRWFNFDNLYLLMLNLTVYPTFVSKSKLKYYYLYCESVDQAIRLSNVLEIISFISLSNEDHFQKTFFQLVHLINKHQT